MMIRRNNVAIRESNDNIDHKKMVITQARSQGGGERWAEDPSRLPDLYKSSLP